MVKIPRIADAYVEIEARTGKYRADISKAKSITTGFGKSATKSLKTVTLGVAALGAAAGVAATAIGVKLSRAIINAGKASVLTAVKYDKLTRGLTAVVGSSKEAEKQLLRLQKVAELPGLSFAGAIQGSINLQAAGIEAELAERALKAFGNALVTVGKGAEDLSGVNLALTQIANKTSGFGQDVRQLQERLPQMQTALKAAFDGKPLEDLNITGKELVAALVTEFEKLPQASGGIANSIENIGISFDLLKNQIGQTFLPVIDKSLKGLTDIIDKIREVLPFWFVYQKQIAKIFVNITTIGIQATGDMMEAMGAIIAAAAPLIFKPIANSAKKFFRDFTTGFSVAVNDVMRFLRVINQKEYEDFLVAVVNSNQEANSKAAENFKNEYESAIRAAVNTAIKGLPKIGETFTTMLADINAELATLTREIEKLQQFKAGLKSLADSFLSSFTPAVYDASKSVGRLNLNMGTLSKTFSQFKIEQLGGKLAQAFGKVGDVSDTAKAKMQAFWDAQREAAQRIQDTIAPAFENLFANLFSGNTKSLWEQFWSDLKQIAIRQIAQIASAQLLAGIFGGGQAQGGGGGGGVGSFLSSFAPLLTAINPVLGGVALAGGFVAGKLEQPKSQQFNFYQTDFANLDQTSIQKTVSQTILPSIDEERADGR